MGVTSILVGDGVNLGALRQGLTEFSQNASKSEKNKQRWQKYSQNPNSSAKKDEDWTFAHALTELEIKAMKLLPGKGWIWEDTFYSYKLRSIVVLFIPKELLKSV